MAEGARDRRNNAADEERKNLAAPEISEEYLGIMSAELFDLQAKRAQLEGAGASAKELKAVEKEIASLQAFVDEHEADYARMEMRAEKAREAEVIPLTRKKEKVQSTTEAPRTISADLQDLQKHYDLTAEQLTSETDPEARAALENSIDNLRERIHTLKGEIPWEKEDRVLAKGGMKRSSAAREQARIDAPESFKAAEIDRAVLIDLRNTYSQSLESGSLPKGGEILLRGAVQTLDDALAKYGRGDMSADAFQKRVAEISKARKTWDRYVKDESVTEQRTEKKERAAAEKTRELIERTRVAITHAEAEARRKTEEAEKAPFRQHGKANGVDYAVGWVGGQEKRYEAFFPQVKYGTPEAKKYNIHDQIFVIGSADKAHAKEVFDKIGEILKKEKNPYRAYAKAWAFESGVAWEEPGAQEFRDMVEKAKEKRDASRAEVRGILEGLAKEREDADIAPPPENLPVEPVAETDEEFRTRFRAKAHPEVDKIVQASIERTNAKIDVLKEKVRAEQERIRIKKNELRPGEEERFFAQGEKPEELAKREQAIENFPTLTPNEAVTEQEKIEAKSARDFENEADFTAAFLDALAHDPLHQLSLGSADAYAKRYWQFLMKDNARLAEAMKPQPKVGFFKRLFSGGPKPKETMTAQEIVYFQKMDKFVRDIMETPATSERAQMFRGSIGKSNPNKSTNIGRGFPHR